jgi:hypothetical protein
MAIATRNPTPPWYRQAWPWFIMALPATAVIAGVITLWLAIKSNDGLVVDDYYKQGLAISQTMERSERAFKLGLEASVRISSDSVIVHMDALDHAALPARLRVRIAHPTRAGHDQILLLTGSNGSYQAGLAPLATGRWDIQIEDEPQTWRLNGAANLPAETEIRVVPTDPKALN